MAGTCLRNSRGAQRFVGYFFLIVLLRFWLAEQTNSYHLSIGDSPLVSPSAKPFIWKSVLLTCKWTKLCIWIKHISSQRLRTRPRFETETKCNSEIVNLAKPQLWLSRPMWSYFPFEGGRGQVQPGHVDEYRIYWSSKDPQLFLRGLPWRGSPPWGH